MTNTIEDKLSTALKAVAATVPDEPPTAWRDARSARRRRNRWSSGHRLMPWSRLAGVGGLAIIAAGAGVGGAAAVGAFTTAIGPAGGLITSSHSAPGEVTRVVAAGPDGSTLEVKSASSNSHSACAALVISDPSDTAQPTSYEPGACDVVGNTAVPPSQTHLSVGYPTARDTWTSATGTVYAIVYGQAPSGAASVDAVNSSGAAAVPATATQRGWFVLAVPASIFQTSSLVFYGSTGTVVTRSTPGGV